MGDRIALGCRVGGRRWPDFSVGDQTLLDLSVGIEIALVFV